MNDQCSFELLESALAGTLSLPDERTLGAHLETCAECSNHLESLAGGPAWRQHAAALLVGDELDESLPARDEWWDVDFSVEHLEPSDDPKALGRVGHYDILEIVGRGGMGVVLKGFDRELKRCVAIKVLAPHLAQSSLAKKRFTREAQAAAAIVHPNVLAIHQVQPNGRLPYLVMPFVAGESLAQRLAAQGTLELKEILRIGMQAAAGLAAAHEQGLVHRDVKPANILLEKGVERAVITDFGLARAADDVSITRLGIISGTPEYMSPEQARGEPLDGRSDLFSLGCVLYELATGVSPFRADSAMATMRRLVDEAPQALASLNPELPPWFCAVVDRLLAKEPARRFSSAKEVSELLEACLAHMQQPSGVPLPATLTVSAEPRSRWPLSLRFTGVLVMIAILGIGLATFLAIGYVDPPDIAGEWWWSERGKIVLKPLRGAEYVATFTDGAGNSSNVVNVSWSRLEGRFVGAVRETENQFGEMSLRLVGADIRGTFTADPKSTGQPRVIEFVWTRADVRFHPIVERDVEGAIDFDNGKMAKIPDLKVDDTNTAIAPVAKWMKESGMDACFDAQSLLAFGLTVIAATNDDWERATLLQLAKSFIATDPATPALARLRPEAKGPAATYLIRTREGSVGLVQLLGFKDDDKSALKIRYKLAAQKLPFVAMDQVPAVVQKTQAIVITEEKRRSQKAFVDGERKIAVAVNDKPWRAVFDWLVDQSGLMYIPAQAELKGSFRFSPPSGATYSFPDVIDIINEGLGQNHQLFIRGETAFRIVSTDEQLDPVLVRRVGFKELERYGKTEIVQILVPLKVMNAQEFAPEVKRQLGPLGSVTPLTAANQLLVTDSAVNLRRLMDTYSWLQRRGE